jgi:hypothetical protein
MKTTTEDTPVSERKWTKGPWEVTYDKNGAVRIGPSHNCTVAVVWFAPHGDSDANAHLAAAAPDLYEALAALIPYTTVLLCDHPVYAKARAALQRAEAEG